MGLKPGLITAIPRVARSLLSTYFITPAFLQVGEPWSPRALSPVQEALASPSPALSLPSEIFRSAQSTPEPSSMHACDLVQLAAALSSNGRAFAENAAVISPTGLEEYWAASRCRLDRWSRTLKAFTAAIHNSRAEAKSQWPAVKPVIEEILLSEILTRVWSGVLYLHDKRNSSREADPVARSVMMGHLEARHRALTLLLYGPGVGTVAAVELNRLRMRVERWIDMLIGGLMQNEDLIEFAIDPERSRDFAEDFRERREQPFARHAWELTLASLSAAFRSLQTVASPNADVNARIASAIMACLPAEIFDATGVLKSLWVARLANVANDAEGMIEELQRMERDVVVTKARPQRF